METGPTNNPQGAPQNPAPTGGQHNMLMAVLSYLGPLVIVSYVMAKNDPFVKFHIKQGLVLFIIEIAIAVLGMIMPGLYMIISLANLATLVLSILGIINAVQKKETPLPVVGSLSKHFSF